MNLENLLLAFPLGAGGIVALIAAVREYLILKNIKTQNYIKVPGEIVEIRTTGGQSRYKVVAPVVKYKYNGAFYNKFIVVQGSVSKYSVGDEVVVLHKPGLKGDWIRIDEEVKIAKPIILFVLGILLIGGAVLFAISS